MSKLRIVFQGSLVVLILSCVGGGALNNPSGEGQPATLGTTSVPEVSGTTPSTSGLNGTPTVNGTAEASAAVSIYTDSTCTTLEATGTADSSGSFSIAVALDGGTSETYYAMATGTGKDPSSCSTTSATFRNTSIRPGLGWFSGTQTTAPTTPTKINQATAYDLQFSSSEYDSTYYSHSTSTNSHQITIATGGDYFASMTLPQTMVSGTYRPCVRIEIRVNGTIYTGAIGESSYIRFDATGNNQGSGHVAILLRNLIANDVITISLQETAGQDGTELVNVTGQASLYLEYVASSRVVFTGTADATSLGTNINQGTASTLLWTAGRNDSGITHSAGTAQNIVLDSAGTYMVYVNVPINSTATRPSPRVLVQLNGATVDGGQAAQGYIRADSGHNDASVHWSGVVRSSAASDILTVLTQQEAGGGTVTVQSGTFATITVERISTSSGVLSLRATDLTSGTDWNPTTASTISWTTSDISDSATFTHATGSNPHQITVLEQGDYLLVYNDSMSSAVQRPNNLIKVQINGTNLSGAETKTHYIRNQNGHAESSASLVFLLRNLQVNDQITLTSEVDITSGTVNDIENALLTLIKK